jgi:Fic family protein
MPQYLHELPGWPVFTWQDGVLAPVVAALRYRQGRLVGRLAGLGLPWQTEATHYMLTRDVLATSEIEQEMIPPESVRSSLARRLGLEAAAMPKNDHVEGIVAVLFDAMQHAGAPLTAERLCAWQAALFPTGRSGLLAVQVGEWRSGVMQVVSGPMGRERVHFEAPAPERLPAEMHRFLAWLNAGHSPVAGEEPIDPVLKAAIAHIWFLTIHPFDDGNGRLARAITDLQLARSEGNPQRGYSMSGQILRERSAYYEILERTQRQADLDITPWLAWFLACLDRSLSNAEAVLTGVLARAEFWQRFSHLPYHPRQRRVLRKLLEGFEGKLTSSKWARIAHCSQDTATRDLQALAAWGVIQILPGGGRNTAYALSTAPGAAPPTTES